MTNNIKETCKKITEAIYASIMEQENPANRIVRSIRVDSSDPLVDRIYITSDYNTFAEEEKLALTTYEKDRYSEEFFNSIEWLNWNHGIGSTEQEFLDEIKTSEVREFSFILDRFFKNPDNEDLKEAAELEACESLITSNGGCNWANIFILRNMGYDVYAGDQDSFSWLTGVIENKDGVKLIYG